MTVAALYVEGPPRGIYPQLLGPNLCWDNESCSACSGRGLYGVEMTCPHCGGAGRRDARLYDGPFPVIAHPPCGPWGRLRHLYRGHEHALAPWAVGQVRRCGGVLEHPAGSLLIDHCGLPRPGELPDGFGGYTIEVCQCDWGHPARKRTWLYLVGVPREAIVLPAPREPTHWISGGRGRVGKKAKTTPVPLGIKICSAPQRRRTPIAFARWLIELAEQAHTSAAAEEGRVAVRNLSELGLTLHCLGRTRLGAPRHPVRLAYDTPLEVYR